jgi:FKBP-type peptidyl-prolyl cis-trans isomerase
MKKLIYIAVIFIAATAMIGACKDSGHSSKLENKVDTMSYVVGEALFRSFDNKGLYLDASQVRQGYLDTRDSSSYMDFKLTQDWITRLELELEMRQEAFTAEEQPTIPLDTVAYAMGADLGFRFNSLDLSLNPDAIYHGINDYSSNGAKASRLPGALYDQTFMEYQEWVNYAAKYKRGQLSMKNLATSEAFFSSLSTDSTVKSTSSGLHYKILKEGQGPVPKVNDSVVVRYQGRFLDGEIFDETLDGETASFLIKEGYLLTGWVEALQMMPVGSSWTLYLPQNLAYGDRGFKDIEPNKALEFDLELVEIK